MALLVLAGASARAAGQELPRLTAIVINGVSQQAIFTGPNGEDPVTVRPGEAIGAYVVEAIRPGEAELSDAAGRYRVRPSAHAGLRSQWAAALPRRPLIDPVRREAETENDQ